MPAASSRDARISFVRQMVNRTVREEASVVSAIACLIASTTNGEIWPKSGSFLADRPSASPTRPSR
ncbi:hypothetical protein SMICM304S_09703 [Streptomyces microflavus]